MIITVINQKGGVGKTTTSQALALNLAKRDYKVLLVDLDGQGSLSKICNADPDKANIYEVLNNDLDIKDAIQTTFIDIVPSDERVYDLQSNIHQLTKLKKSLETIKPFYDFIVIDNAPALSNLSLSSLIASDGIVIPVERGIQSLESLALLNGTIATAKDLNPKLEILGIFINKYDSRTNLDQESVEILTEMAERMETRFFKTKVRKSVALEVAQGAKQNMFDVKHSDNAISDYEHLTSEILEVIRND